MGVDKVSESGWRQTSQCGGVCVCVCINLAKDHDRASRMGEALAIWKVNSPLPPLPAEVSALSLNFVLLKMVSD